MGRGEKRVFPVKNYDLEDVLILNNIRFLMSVFEVQWTVSSLLLLRGVLSSLLKC